MHRTTAEATRARKGRIRAAADAASLLNYHPDLETPPAWALKRLHGFPPAWAEHARQRLGEPGEITFTLPSAVVRIRCERLDGTGGYARAFERLSDGSQGRPLAEGDAVLPIMGLEAEVPKLAA